MCALSRKIRPPKIVKASGRPDAAQKIVISMLQISVRDLQEWLIVNNKVATGKAVNGFSIVVKAIAGGTGWSGTIKGIGYINSVLYGVPKGTFPPPANIEKWLRIKGIRSEAYSIRELSWAISRKINQVGTNPPFLDRNIQRNMVAFNARAVTKKAAPLWRVLKATEFMERVTKVLDFVNKYAVGASFATKLSKSGKRVTNASFKLPQSQMFKYRFKLEKFGVGKKVAYKSKSVSRLARRGLNRLTSGIGRNIFK